MLRFARSRKHSRREGKRLTTAINSYSISCVSSHLSTVQNPQSSGSSQRFENLADVIPRTALRLVVRYPRENSAISVRKLPAKLPLHLPQSKSSSQTRTSCSIPRPLTAQHKQWQPSRVSRAHCAPASCPPPLHPPCPDSPWGGQRSKCPLQRGGRARGRFGAQRQVGSSSSSAAPL